jgi:hypothetical protein
MFLQKEKCEKIQRCIYERHYRNSFFYKMKNGGFKVSESRRLAVML